MMLLLGLLTVLAMMFGVNYAEAQLEGMTVIATGVCRLDKQVRMCEKLVKKGEEGFYVAIMSEDDEELAVLIRVLNGKRKIVWRKEEKT